MPPKTVNIQTEAFLPPCVPLPEHQLGPLRSSASFRHEFWPLLVGCVVTGQCRAHWGHVSLTKGKSCTILGYVSTQSTSCSSLCQLHCGLVFSEGLFLIIVQLLVCLKEGIDFEMIPAPLLPCVFVGAWQKGSYWCSGEKRSVMDWKSVYFTLKSSSTRFWVVFKKKSINAT